MHDIKIRPNPTYFTGMCNARDRCNIRDMAGMLNKSEYK